MELGAIRNLSDLFFIENNCAISSANDRDGKLRGKIIQAISAIVRSHDLGEAVFCRLDQAVPLIQAGLLSSMQVRVAAVGEDNEAEATPLSSPTVLVKRTLFFLRALVTSDAADCERVRQFSSCIGWTVDKYLLTAQKEESNETSDYETEEICEMALAMVEQILEQAKSVDCILSRKEALVSASVQRITALRAVSATVDSNDNLANAVVQLQHWENVLALLARAVPDALNNATPESTQSMAQ